SKEGVDVAGCLLVDAVERVGGALALLFGGGAHHVVLRGDRLRAAGAGVGDDGGHVRRARLRGFERGGGEVGKKAQTLGRVLRLAVEFAEQSFERAATLGQRRLGAAVADVDRFRRGGKRAPVLVELGCGGSDVAQHRGGSAVERLDVLFHLGAGLAAALAYL